LAFLKSYRFFLIAIACVIAVPSFSQNTKGDKPASNQRSILRIPHLKTKRKDGDKAHVGDITGRRIRTKNKSSAVRVKQMGPRPYARKRATEVSRVGKPVGGYQRKFKSTTAKAARNNVYPNTNNYLVNNPSPHPHDNQRTVFNRRQLSKAASMSTRREPPGRKKRITPRSASSSFITRGRKNVYWGKFRKGETAITTDITGRTLRAKNFHSPGLGVIPAKDVYRKRKSYGDRPYKGPFKTGFVSMSRKNQRSWSGDVSGHAIRARPPKVSQSPGESKYSGYLSNSHARGRTSKSAPVKGPGLSVNLVGKFLNRLKGRRTPKGGGSVSQRLNNKGQPILVRQPGIGANMGNYRGDIRQQGKTLNQEGIGYSGFTKSRRSLKGGGSNTRVFNNNGQPINVMAPGIGANMGNYSGNIRGRTRIFNQEGSTYSGDIRTRRPLKGGGSISGRGFNNGGRAVDVRAPGIGASMGNYKGNLKSMRPLKGGGSISGRGFNNGGRAVDVRAPGMGANMGNYSGNSKSIKPFKGGGSISGKTWNNTNKPIDVKGPGIGSKFVGQYTGFFRATRAPKGGGSNSGFWNNRGRPVNVRAPGSGAKYVDQYQGLVKRYEISPGFGYQGETYKGWIKTKRPLKGGGSISNAGWNNGGNPINRKAYSPDALKVSVYAGSLKARRPLKGGGSISGKLWNNKEQPILTKVPALAGASEMGYSGRIKLPFFSKKYIRNPKADKEALKKIRPDKSTYEVAGLQIKVKQKDYEHNKLASKESLKGVAPGKNSLKAAEYEGHLKMLWSYKHNPRSNENALKSIKPTYSFLKGSVYAGGMKMKKYVHNPYSNKNALNVLAPGRAVARMGDYQGNLKMSKPHGKNLLPDAQFAHSFRGNVKHDRTFLMNVKLKWAKLFKKNGSQPEAVKEKVRRPRYDKKERDLWKDLYD